MRNKFKIFIMISLAAMVATYAETRKKKSGSITIKAVGDIVPGTLYPERRIPANPYEDLFGPIQEYLSGADLLFGNFESTLTDYPTTSKNTSSKHVFAFRTPPSTAKVLKRAGFQVLSTANNHSGDFGERGFKDTMQNLKAVGIHAIGRKGQIEYLTVSGVKMAFIPFSYLRSHGTLDREHTAHFALLMDQISDPQDQADIIHCARNFYRLYGEVFRGLPLPQAAPRVAEAAA